MNSTLKPKQQRFVQEYLISGNATQAAIQAGYDPCSAYNQGYRLTNNDEVRRCIFMLMDRSVYVLVDTMNNAKIHRQRLKAATIALNLIFYRASKTI